MDDAAFGSNPGTWPLPAAHTPEHLWLRAVAAGGQGRYSTAQADLDRLLRVAPHGRLASLAHSTRASFFRQLGWHDRARPQDGRAWALSDGAGEAGADALLGLAADALGTGRFAASECALRRAVESIDATACPRLPVRLAWVSAELAMVQGQGAAAVGHAERAVHLAGQYGSARHRVKSLVVLAAAHCTRGELDAARRDAADALAQSADLALVPLQWAAACLLADLAAAGPGEHLRAQVTAVRDTCAETVTRRGGVWRSR